MTRLLLTAALAASLVTPAMAGTVDVRTSDLDLSTAQGRAMLDTRVGRAARKVCAAPGVRGVAELARADECRRTALAAAQPHVTALVARADTRLAQARSAPAL